METVMPLNRRDFVTASLAASTIAATGGINLVGAAAEPASGPFTLPPLPYDQAALEPHIDAKTMELHHGKHHAAYVNNLNAALQGQGKLAGLALNQLLAGLSDIPEPIRNTVRNNAGGHANHTMFWQVMAPGGRAMPEGELKDAIERDFGGMEKLKEQFNGAGKKVFGSGWVFVTVDKGGKLALVSKPNQDTPLMEGGRVLFGNDVWEHAYYLKYQNKRPEYLEAWWHVVNWEAVANRYAAAKAGTLAI